MMSKNTFRIHGLKNLIVRAIYGTHLDQAEQSYFLLRNTSISYSYIQNWSFIYHVDKYNISSLKNKLEEALLLHTRCFYSFFSFFFNPSGLIFFCFSVGKSLFILVLFVVLMFSNQIL